MKPVKVLYCIDCLVRGGTELQLIGVIDRIDRSKYEPYLLTIRDSDSDLVPNDCHHLNWSVPSLFSIGGLTAIIKLTALLKKEDISIVQTFFQDSTIFAGFAAMLANVPVRLASFRDMGFWHTPSQGFLLKRIYALMTGYVCNAEIIRSHYSALYKVDKDKIKVIRNGINVDELPWVAHQENVMHVGIIGNMTRHVKRTDLFIKAASKVATQYPLITWHIIGDGHLMTELMEQARLSGIDCQCCFTGRIDDVENYLEKLQIGVICSDSEGLSNAILEYMFKGVATIATDVGGNPELVLDGVTGLLVPKNDHEALGAALIRLIENKTLRHQLARDARKLVERNYGWDQCLSSHDDYYQAQLALAKGL